MNSSVIVAPEMIYADGCDNCGAVTNNPEKVTSAPESDPLTLNVVGSGSSISLLGVLDVGTEGEED